MNRYLLEACVDSVESAIAAQDGGAERLELCSNLIIGGTTPGIKLFHEVQRNVSIPIRVLIRPRYGDFLYTKYEYEIVKQEVQMFREAGAEGIVIGCLNEDGTLDMERTTELFEQSKGMKVTVHRAFDMVKDPMAAFEQLKELGVDAVLTSGQRNHCLEGADLIRKLVDSAKNRIHILVGGGVNATIIEQMIERTGAKHFHMSGKEIISSAMLYRNEDVSMGLPFFSEYQMYRTSKKEIEKAKKAIVKANFI
ncbi:MAG TPA: copper homeostasis protein CutC [Lachnospiraceae bacterium]|nr:copper homeostasis protein CutC [Lachnospiraceae bacterium]